MYDKRKRRPHAALSCRHQFGRQLRGCCSFTTLRQRGVSSSFFRKPDYDKHEPCTQRHTTRPSWDRALLLHFRLDVTELQNGLIVRVTRLPDDDPQAQDDKDQSRNLHGTHSVLSSSPGASLC